MLTADWDLLTCIPVLVKPVVSARAINVFNFKRIYLQIYNNNFF